MKKKKQQPYQLSSASELRKLPSHIQSAAKQLGARLHDPQSLRCWGCGEVKPPAPDWHVGTYAPPLPWHPAMAYAICPQCQNAEGFARARLAIETKARELADEKRRGL